MYKFPSLTPKRQVSGLALLTSGGDSPGMNPAIRAIVRTALNRNIKVFGVNKGYRGLITDDLWEMDSASVSNIIQRGGTILKSDRCEAFKSPDVRKIAADKLRARGIDSLVVIGGDGSLTGAHLLAKEQGISVIGLPGTIDNDIFGTDDTIGFDTAVNTALEAIDKIRDTAMSHDRLFLVEVMGRNSGHIASHVGIACGAEMIVVPEDQLSIEEICHELATNHERGLGSSGLIVVAEGQEPGLTNRLATQLKCLAHQPRVCILGHIQRGGSPTGHDRVLAACLGSVAIDYLEAGETSIMVGIEHGKIVPITLEAIATNKKTFDKRLYKLTRELHR